MKQSEMNFSPASPLLITAGSSYLDIDAYACMVSLTELMRLRGENAAAYSAAPCNYSVCPSLTADSPALMTALPADFPADSARYILVDVSDPDFIRDFVPPEQVIGVYDHHAGFEEYWTGRIGENARIEFIGAAATLIYREWKKAGLQDSMSRCGALLLIAAILDNTLNLTSANTTAEDREAFRELCEKASVGEEWCAAYFSEVQAGVEADLKNALFNDIKTMRDTAVLPSRIAQLCVWDARSILEKLPEIRRWFADTGDSWMLNVIELSRRRSYFICDDDRHRNEIGRVFGVPFEAGIAQLPVSLLRKEIIKKACYSK